MELEWTMLTNYAEIREGLLFISSGTWDTVNVQGPLEGAPPNIVAVFQGFFVARLGFHGTEVPSDHSFRLIVMDEDGGELGFTTGEFHAERVPGIPPEWSHGFNIIIGLTGLPLPKFGQYSLELLIDGAHAGTRPFRVLKLY